MSEGDGFVGDFEKKLTSLNEQETFQSAMTYEEDQKLILNTKKKISFEEGVSEGITQGISQRNEEIAKAMLAKNMDIKTISECIGLKEEEIKRLQEY